MNHPASQFTSTSVLLFTLMSFLGSVRAQDFAWESRTPMPAARWGSGTFVTNGLAYVVGGRSNGIDYPQMWAYDPNANSWQQKADFPGTPRRLATVFAANGKGYYGLGINGTSNYMSDFWEYDPVANSWTQRASFPAGPRYNTWQFVLNGIGYVGNGINTGASGPFLSDAFMYNPATNMWTSATPIPDQGRHGAIGFAMNGKGYVVCGRENSLNFVQDFWSFDPSTGTWSAMASFLGAGRSSPLAFVYYNDAVVGCGRDASINHFDAWLYRPTTNSWSSIPPYPGYTAMAGASFSIGNRAFGGLGWDLSTDLSHADLWELVKPGNVGVEESDTPSYVSAQPNPADDDGFLLSSGLMSTMQVQLLAADGRLIDQWTQLGSQRIRTDRLASGYYLIQWQGDGEHGTIKLMVH